MKALVGTAVLLMALTGCGDGDEASEDVRACSELAGETIEGGFEGCMEGHELKTVSASHDCIDGRTLAVVSDDIGWAFEGEEWHEGSSEDARNECYGLDDEPLEPTDEPTVGTTEDPREEPTEEPTEEPASSGPPDCATTWVEGATLPVAYNGCMEGGKEVPAAVFECKDGSQLTGYDGRFYAFVGGEIMPSSDREGYTTAFADCLG